jgi:hypothetical protein
MDGMQHRIARDGNGRFLPGCSGNPTGKKPGTRNRATVLREMLGAGEDRKLARIVIDKALAGDVVTARFLLGRLEPKPRGRPIELDLPEGESAAGDVVAAFNAALRAMAAGEITPAEAVDVSRFLEGRFRVLRAWQLEEKLTQRNTPLPVPGDDVVPEGTAERVKSPLRSVAARNPSNFPAPPAQPPHIPSTPAERGERGEFGAARAMMAPPMPALAAREAFVPDINRDRLATSGVSEFANQREAPPKPPLHSACIFASHSGQIASLNHASRSTPLADPRQPRY